MCYNKAVIGVSPNWLRHRTLTPALAGSNPVTPARKKHARKGVLFSMQRAAAHEAGLCPMKSLRYEAWLRHMRTRAALHGDNAAAAYKPRACASYSRSECFIACRCVSNLIKTKNTHSNQSCQGCIARFHLVFHSGQSAISLNAGGRQRLSRAAREWFSPPLP